jgi:hypothetical protein
MFHSNFTDIASRTPINDRVGVAGPINPQRAHDIVDACSFAFLDRHVVDPQGDLFDRSAKLYRDATCGSRGP